MAAPSSFPFITPGPRDPALDALWSFVQAEALIPDGVFLAAVGPLVYRGETWALRHDALLTDAQIEQMVAASWAILPRWLDGLERMEWRHVVAVSVLLGEWGAAPELLEAFMAQVRPERDLASVPSRLLLLMGTLPASSTGLSRDSAAGGAAPGPTQTPWRQQILAALRGTRVVLVGGGALDWHMARAAREGLVADGIGRAARVSPDLDLCYADDPETRASLIAVLRFHGAVGAMDAAFWGSSVQHVTLPDGGIVDLLRRVSGGGTYSACRAHGVWEPASMDVPVLARRALRDVAWSTGRSKAQRQLVKLALLDSVAPEGPKEAVGSGFEDDADMTGLSAPDNVTRSLVLAARARRRGMSSELARDRWASAMRAAQGADLNGSLGMSPGESETLAWVLGDEPFPGGDVSDLAN